MRPLQCGMFIFVALLASPASGLGSEIDARTAYALAQAGQLLIIDIRRPSEWEKTGLPAPGVGISLQNSLRKIRRGFPDDVLDAVDGNKDRPIALICASGGRSARAVELLQEIGFSRIHDISEGMFGNGKEPGWLAQNLPVAACESC